MGGGWIEHRGEPCEMMRDGPESNTAEDRMHTPEESCIAREGRSVGGRVAGWVRG